jgi:hypothetical protein
MLVEALTLVAAFLLIVILGIVTAFSPTLFFTELAVLTRSKNAFRQTTIFLLGIATPIALLVLAYNFLLGPDVSYNRDINIPSAEQIISTVPLLTLLIGTACIGTGVWLRFFHNTQNDDKNKKHHSLNIMRSSVLYWFGCIHMGLSLSTIAGVLLGANLVKSLLHSPPLQAIGFIWLIAMVMLPFVSIMAIYFLWPKAFVRIQTASDRLAAFNYYPLASYTLFVLGVVLVLLCLTIQT